MSRRRLVPLSLIATLLVIASPAAAHTHVQVADGQYELTVGWREEPPYAGVPNGLDLGVSRIAEGHGDGAHGHDGEKVPVEGLLGNLTVTYEIAGKTFSPPEWRAQFGRPGWYTAEVTPTREGEYTVHVVGEIEGNAVDVRVKPAVIESTAKTMFPEPDLTPEEASAKIADLEQQVADLKTQLTAVQSQLAALQTEPSAPATNDSPGVGVSVASLAVIGVALVLGKRN